MNYVRGTNKIVEMDRELITRDEILVKVKMELKSAQERMKSIMIRKDVWLILMWGTMFT